MWRGYYQSQCKSLSFPEFEVAKCHLNCSRLWYFLRSSYVLSDVTFRPSFSLFLELFFSTCWSLCLFFFFSIWQRDVSYTLRTLSYIIQKWFALANGTCKLSSSPHSRAPLSVLSTGALRFRMGCPIGQFWPIAGTQRFGFRASEVLIGFAYRIILVESPR